jgi:hypothetical protein
MAWLPYIALVALLAFGFSLVRGSEIANRKQKRWERIVAALELTPVHDWSDGSWLLCQMLRKKRIAEVVR